MTISLSLSRSVLSLSLSLSLSVSLSLSLSHTHTHTHTHFSFSLFLKVSEDITEDKRRKITGLLLDMGQSEVIHLLEVCSTFDLIIQLSSLPQTISSVECVFFS